MFHPDRLTGARRRAWERSCDYAPGYDWDSVPKTVREKIKDPFRLKALARVNNHWIAVVGHQVALIHHPHEDEEQAIHAIAGTKASERWTCKCNTVRGLYATWTRRRVPKSDDKNPNATPIAWAQSIDELPASFIKVREMCRKPTDREYRFMTEKSVYGRRRGKRRSFDWKSGESKKPEPYQAVPLQRWNAGIVKARVWDEAILKLSNRLTQQTGFDVSLVASNRDYRISERFTCLKPERDGGKWLLKCNFDPYTWYCRVRGRVWAHTPKKVVPISMFRIGPVEVFFGLRLGSVDGVPGDAPKGKKGEVPSFEAVVWYADGSTVPAGSQAYDTLTKIEYGLRVVHPKKDVPEDDEDD